MTHPTLPPKAAGSPRSCPTPTLTSQEREALITRHLPMVRRLALRMARAFPASVDPDDLISLGTLGLIDAVDRFVPDRSVSFTAFARIRARGAIVDAMRSDDWVPRTVRDRNARLRTARQRLELSLGRPATPKELAAHLGVSEARLRELEDRGVIRDLVSLDAPIDDDTSLGTLLPADGQTPDADAEAADLRRALAAVLARLPERDRTILELSYFREKEFKEIAAILGVTESRISQIHKRILEDLRANAATRSLAA